MQDAYVGDIGDYGKYGLLRAVTASGLRLSVNWYRTVLCEPEKKKREGSGETRRQQEDGKYTSYLGQPKQYRHYDPELFDCLAELVQQERTIGAIQTSGILTAQFFEDALTGADRQQWHQKALHDTAGAEVVFLDPDNGLESARMHRRGSATDKHITWEEVKDYYGRGQSVILYHHRPQRMKKETCIRNLLDFQQSFLKSDQVFLLEYPRYTNRFYFIFSQAAHQSVLEQVYRSVVQAWQGLCHPVDLSRLSREP